MVGSVSKGASLGLMTSNGKRLCVCSIFTNTEGFHSAAGGELRRKRHNEAQQEGTMTKEDKRRQKEAIQKHR